MAVEDIPESQIRNERTSYDEYLWQLPGSAFYRWDENVSYMYTIGAIPVPGQGLPPKPPVPPLPSPFTNGEMLYLDGRYVLMARKVIAGTGLTGGGDLTTDVSISLSQATIDAIALAATAVQPSALSVFVKSVAGVTPDSNGAVTITPATIGAAQASHTHTISQISDAGTTGKSLMGAATAAAALTTLGAPTRAETVRTVNGVAPDANGNVAVSGSGGGVPTTRQVATGTGLQGGGDLSADRTLSLTSAAVASLAKADSSVQKVNGTAPDASGNVVVSASVPNYDAFRDIKFVSYGHSFGQQQTGPMNTTAAGVYPERLSQLLGVDLPNYANRTVSGARAADVLTTVLNTWRRGDYGLVTLMLTQNDAGYRTSQTSFKASLTSIINWLRGPGQFPPTIVFILDTYDTTAGYSRYPTPPTDAVMDTYNQYIRDVVATYPSDGSIILADANAGWVASTYTGPDGQHPNDRGSAAIANAVLKAIANAPFREGQNIGITPPSYFYDSFNRASGTSLGVPMYGYGTATSYTIFSAAAGATFGISAAGGVYRSDTTANGEAVFVTNTSSSVVDEQITLDVITTKGMGPAWRAADASNYWVVDVFGTGVGNAKVYKRLAGAFTQVGSALSIEVKSGDTLRVTHTSAGVITVYVNGVSAFTATDNALSSNTMHGGRITEISGSGRLNDLILK